MAASQRTHDSRSVAGAATLGHALATLHASLTRTTDLPGGRAMRINRKRLEDTMNALGRIGETPAGGLTRLALSDEDRRGRDLLVGWMREAGLRVSIDQMGNIMGVSAGADGPPVMMGSHADSVPTGGKYDGQLGV